MSRRRATYAVAAAFVLLAGLLWRSDFLSLPAFARKYGGSALWALLVYFLICWMAPHVAAWKSAGAAFAVSVAVEFSQFYHAPWIDTIRETRLGALTLGSFFNWPDILAYGCGIALGALVDSAFRRRWKS